MILSKWLWFACLTLVFSSLLFAQNDWPGYGKDALGQRH
jgi:hypothetical protein